MTRAVLTLLVCSCLAIWSPGMAEGDAAVDLGHCDNTVILRPECDQCTGELTYNHDDSFENAYCWQLDGVLPPYYGAWGEAYDLGPTTVECGVFWFTTVSNFYPPPIDIYVWAAGVQGPPGEVLCLIPDVEVDLALWPSVFQNNIKIGCCVSGEFTVGYWEPAQLDMCYIFCAADETGAEGRPWTNIAPGIGYPTGWQHPNIVHPDCISLGIGLTSTEYPSPITRDTWGAIKSVFQQ